jgi:hypothetical protein|tara:strand:- start:176 stop:475 length:300 start_codon:yes stop_codon:yes gene_type:complete
MNIPALDIGLSKDFAVEVHTSNGRGFNPEEIAERCADKIISVSDTAHPAIQAQARAFKDNIVKLVEFYLAEAVKNDRTTVYNALTDAGHPELASLIRRL